MSMSYSDNLDRYVVEVRDNTDDAYVWRLRTMHTEMIEDICDALYKLLHEDQRKTTDGICYNVGDYLHAHKNVGHWQAHDSAIDFVMACAGSWRLKPKHGYASPIYPIDCYTQDVHDLYYGQQQRYGWWTGVAGFYRKDLTRHCLDIARAELKYRRLQQAD